MTFPIPSSADPDPKSQKAPKLLGAATAERGDVAQQEEATLRPPKPWYEIATTRGDENVTHQPGKFKVL